MINEERVKLMTRIALYEKNHTADEISMGKYYKSDYVGLKMIGTLFWGTIGFVLIYFLVLVLNSEAFIKSLTRLDIVGMLMNVGIAYICFMAGLLILTYILYSYRFRRGRESLKHYNADLKRLIKMLKEDEREKKAMLREKTSESEEEEEDDFDIISL